MICIRIEYTVVYFARESSGTRRVHRYMKAWAIKDTELMTRPHDVQSSFQSKVFKDNR